MNSSFTEDESIDSAGEEYDTEQLKLQDIAAIVFGDVKQVCINGSVGIDPYSINNVDASENAQEVVNGNDVEVETPSPDVENRNESDEIDAPLNPVNEEPAFKPIESDEINPSLNSVNEEPAFKPIESDEINPSLSSANEEPDFKPIESDEINPSLNSVNEEPAFKPTESDEINPPLNTFNEEHTFEPIDQCSSPNTSPGRLTPSNINYTLRSSSLSPIAREITPENTERDESTGESANHHSAGSNNALKVLDEVKDSPRSCESPSLHRTQNSASPCVGQPNEQNESFDVDNHNPFCDKENLDKLSQCDRLNDGECTPRDGSKTPILFSPSSQDFGAEGRDCTLENGPDEGENETCEEKKQNEGFESANELWKEEEDLSS